MSNDLEYCYTLATSKGGAPAARTMSALNDWCVARGSGALATGAAILAFITAYSGAGSATYTTPGSYSFTVPYYASLTVDVWSGSGGGAAGDGSNGGNGGSSAFGSVSASGGGGGQRVNGAGGIGGTGYNGDTNDTGGSGTAGTVGNAGVGGAAPSGGYGGGGNGGECTVCDGKGCYPGDGGGGGGGSGHAKKTFGVGDLTPGSTITIVVGAAGTAGADSGVPDQGYVGIVGKVAVSWT